MEEEMKSSIRGSEFIDEFCDEDGDDKGRGMAVLFAESLRLLI